MKKIDSHFHINLHKFDLETIIDYLDKNKLDKVWLLSWEEKKPPIKGLYKSLPVEELMDAYEKYPDRIVPFYAPDPGRDDIREIMTALKEKGLKGCGELKVTYNWGDKEMDSYLETVSALKLPLLFHMELPRHHYVKSSSGILEKFVADVMNGALNGTLRYYFEGLFKVLPIIKGKLKRNMQYFPGYMYDFVELEKRIVQFPDINFIGHGPHFWNNISATLSKKYIHQKGNIKELGIIDTLLEKYDNFYCDISGTSGYNALTRNKNISKSFLEKHCDKILFGTDNT
ncbi:MAG: hypothetical protein C0599_02330, partial [Salinivirgaceae bacterium]